MAQTAPVRRRRRSRIVAFEIDHETDGDLINWRELLSSPAWIEMAIAALVTTLLLWHVNEGVVAQKLIIVAIVIGIHGFALTLIGALQRFPKFASWTIQSFGRK